MRRGLITDSKQSDHLKILKNWVMLNESTPNPTEPDYKQIHKMIDCGNE